MKSVVFDVGNVLLKWDPYIPMRRHFEDDDAIRGFFEDVGFQSWNLSLDKGRDWDEAVETLSQAHPSHAAAIEVFRDFWHESVPHEITDTVEVLNKLGTRNVPRYAITNFSGRRWDESLERFPFLSDSFSDVVVSGKEKLVKPDVEIFQLFLERNNLHAGDCIFIDDSAANIASASKIGFDTIRFDEDTDLTFELNERGVML